jgi:hypothetical protein
LAQAHFYGFEGWVCALTRIRLMAAEGESPLEEDFLVDLNRCIEEALDDRRDALDSSALACKAEEGDEDHDDEASRHHHRSQIRLGPFCSVLYSYVGLLNIASGPRAWFGPAFADSVVAGLTHSFIATDSDVGVSGFGFVFWAGLDSIFEVLCEAGCYRGSGVGLQGARTPRADRDREAPDCDGDECDEDDDGDSKVFRNKLCPRYRRQSTLVCGVFRVDVGLGHIVVSPLYDFDVGLFWRVMLFVYL